MNPIFSRAAVALAALCGLQAGPAFGQGLDFPNKPIRLVVPFPAGGATDILGRQWGKRLSDVLKQPVIIENIGGAAGTIGAANVARSAPDGYTLLLGATVSLTIAPSLYPKLPYDALKAFAPIGQISTFGNALIANAAAPVRNVADLAGWARRTPQGVSYGTWGVGSAGHLAMEMVKNHYDAPLVHIPYKGTAAVLSDVMGNQVPVGMATVLEIEPAVKAGKVRIIAVTGSKRAPNFPDVPTLAEQGVPIKTDSWFAAFAPAGTPEPVLEKLRGAFQKVQGDPAFQKELVTLGMNPSTLDVQQFAAALAADIGVWAELVKSSGATAE